MRPYSWYGPKPGKMTPMQRLKTVKLLALNTSVYDAEQKREHMPPRLGLKAFHSGHRSNLLRKDPTHYGQFGWTDDPANDYYWPVQ